MTNAGNKMKTAYAAIVLATIVLKIAADYRRHPQHEAHSQKCQCFANCVVCAFNAATGKG